MYIRHSDESVVNMKLSNDILSYMLKVKNHEVET